MTPMPTTEKDKQALVERVRSLVQRLRERVSSFDKAAMAFDVSLYGKLDSELDLEAAAAITVLFQQVERQAKHKSDLLGALTTIQTMQEDAERRLAEARGKLRPVLLVGAQMANAMFNLAQRGELTDDVRRQFDEMRKAWDAASPALVSAIRQSGDSNVG